MHSGSEEVDYDVAVLGAGPAAVAAAIRLALLGWSVNIWRNSGHRRTRWEGVSSRVLATLQAMGLTRTLASVTQRCRQINSWGTRKQNGGDEYFVDRDRFDLALIEDAVDNSVTQSRETVAHLSKYESNWIVHTDAARVRVRAVIDARGRRAMKAPFQVGPRLVAVSRWYGGVAGPPTTGVMSGHRAWYWFAADGRGRCQVQAVTAPTDSFNSRSELEATLFGRRAIPAVLRHILRGADPVGDIRACAAGARFALPAEVEGRVVAGDAALALDPLSGHGIYEALSANAVVVASVNTWLERGEWRPARQFMYERAREIWRRKLLLAASFYEEAAATEPHPFWIRTARAYLALAHANAGSPMTGIPEVQRRPVLNGERIELREVLVTPQRPRGVWRYRNIEIAMLLESWRRCEWNIERQANRFGVTPQVIRDATSWLQSEGVMRADCNASYR